MAHPVFTSDDMAELGDSPYFRHSLSTRLVHAGLAVAIVMQLGSSQFMDPDGAGNLAFSLHQYGGLAAFGFVAAFWALAAFRRRGTPFLLLVPWTSRGRIAAVWHDARKHLSAMSRLSLPSHEDEAPLASAVHGLGLLLMSVMALSGTIYYFINSGDPDAGGLVAVTMTVHTLFANLVWAYLIGHAGLAVLAHATRTLPLSEMWSFRSGGQ